MGKNYKDRKPTVMMMMTMVVVIVVVEVEISTVISMTRLHLCKSPAILTPQKVAYKQLVRYHLKC